MRKIPATMATQHPDNASAPYWSDSPFISTGDEVEECYRVFSDLGCDEYMWDWEGKFVDEAVVDRLFNKYEAYFQKNQLGKNKFLTFRVPNIWKEQGFRLARSYMTIITAAHTAAENGMHTPPIFEVILPMTTEARQLIAVLAKYKNALKYERAIFEKEVAGTGTLEMIPLIEGSATLLQSRKILKDYVTQYRKLWKQKIPYLRPFIARSDPALDAGFVPAVLSARGAISEYYRFEEDSGIPVYPIIGVGSPLFRGGLSPNNLDSFLKNYAGVRTVTIQSAFRYDYPMAEVKRAMETLNRVLPKLKPVRFSEDQISEILRFSEHFAGHYRPAVMGLASVINDLARFVPSHRERIPHTGHFGYSRQMNSKAGKKINLPRAISFVATLASLGIPPSLIGTGRGLKALLQSGVKEKKIFGYLPTFIEDLGRIGAYLNWENLKFLVRKNPAWQPVLDDVTFLEEFLGHRLGPKTRDEYIHRNLTSNIYHYWNHPKRRDGEVKDAILQAARVRRSLG